MNEQGKVKVLLGLTQATLRGDEWARNWMERIASAEDTDAIWREFWQDFHARSVEKLGGAANDIADWAERAGEGLMRGVAEGLRAR